MWNSSGQLKYLKLDELEEEVKRICFFVELFFGFVNMKYSDSVSSREILESKVMRNEWVDSFDKDIYILDILETKKNNNERLDSVVDENHQITENVSSFINS